MTRVVWSAEMRYIRCMAFVGLALCVFSVRWWRSVGVLSGKGAGFTFWGHKALG